MQWFLLTIWPALCIFMSAGPSLYALAWSPRRRQYIGCAIVCGLLGLSIAPPFVLVGLEVGTWYAFAFGPGRFRKLAAIIGFICGGIYMYAQDWSFGTTQLLSDSLANLSLILFTCGWSSVIGALVSKYIQWVADAK